MFCKDSKFDEIKFEIESKAAYILTDITLLHKKLDELNALCEEIKSTFYLIEAEISNLKKKPKKIAKPKKSKKKV